MQKKIVSKCFVGLVISLILVLPWTECGRRGEPNQSGGYDLVVAVEQGTIEPPGVDQYLDNIRTSLEEFSKLLYSATGKLFHLNSATVIIPYHWELNSNETTDISYLENYHNADMRLSRSIQFPHVENPNACGSAGAYINLPLEFFNDTSSTNAYGEPRKSLLTSWARYRWGTWEEHGYPGDPKFPYFYKDPMDGWTATGCSDSPLKGNFSSVVDEQKNCTPGDSNMLYAPEGDCRFQPNAENQTAISSLAYFPWISTVESFCNNKNHNAQAPNKQNLYCRYRSITEVIEASQDRVRISNPAQTLPAMQFVVKREARAPLFYLLVDTGSFSVPPTVYEEIINGTSHLFTHEALSRVIGKAETFPSAVENGTVDQKLDWRPITAAAAEFVNVTTLFEQVQSEDPGSFAVALEEVINELRSIRHPAGAMVLVLKHGFSPEAFGKVYESELISKLQTGNIVVHALEIRESALTPKLHLESLATQSGGQYLAVLPTSSVAVQVESFVSRIVDQLDAGKPAKHQSKPIFTGFMNPNDNFTLPFHTVTFPNATKLVFTLTVNRSVTPPTDPWISVLKPKNASQPLTLQHNYEWNESSDTENRLVVRNMLQFPLAISDEPWTFKYTGCSPASSCTAFVTVYYELPTVPDIDFDLDIEVMLNNDQVPTLIFAKITQNGQPVVGLESVTASLTNFRDALSYLSIPLRDNGPNDLDAISEDGVYSGAFIPGQDGLYSVAVTVSGRKASRDFLVDHVHRDSAVQSLLGTEQKTVGCPSWLNGCGVVGLELPLIQMTFHPDVVELQGSSETYVGRILDLDAIALPGFLISLTWTVPTIMPENAVSDSDYYDIRTSTSFESLLTSFESAEKVNGNNCTTFAPGSECSVTVQANSPLPMYFAVRINGTGFPVPDRSNIVVVTPEDNPIRTTTTTTTLAPTTGSSFPSPPDRPETTSTTITTTQLTTTLQPDKDKYWYQTYEGKVTLSLFVAGVMLIFTGVGLKFLVQRTLFTPRDVGGDTQQLKTMF